MSVCDDGSSCGYIDLIRKQFLCAYSVNKIDWDTFVDHLSNLTYPECIQHQDLLLSTTFESPTVSKFPVKSSYKRVFLKKLLAEVEKHDIAHPAIYDLYVKVLSESEQIGDHFRHFILPSGRIIKLKESDSIISKGTTGLSVWQGGIALTEWAFQHSSLLQRKNILELGCGVGFTGIALCLSEVYPESYVFSDYHPDVLETLELNIKINDLSLYKGESINNSNTKIKVVPLNWEEVDDFSLDSSFQPEVILAADVVYDQTLFDSLCKTLNHFLRNKDTFAVLACTLRSEDTLENFLKTLSSAGLHSKREEEVPPKKFFFENTSPVHIYIVSAMQNTSKVVGDPSADSDDLLVFGYACKVFRDDEKAQMIDSGQHLIPWMGDDSLKIDRYDGRGTLYDLASHEPNPTSFEQLTYDELETERLCDKERYRFLSKNEEEEAIYQEEEMKRFYQQTNAYSQVAYVYEDQALPTVEENPVSDDVTSQSKPFVLPTELSVPPDMTLPETMKLHAIIERTALFISQQGPQMEIIMKLKQHGNKQFDFLSHNDPLHPYYKLLLTSIKSGSYTPAEEKSWSDVEEQEEQDDNGDDDEDEDDNDGHYLHPSLAAKPSLIPPTVNDDLPVSDKTSQKTEPEISADNPPEDVKKIVEVMVKYMAKNGPPFEVQIIKMCDSRFSFLNPSNKFYQYYQNRLKEAPKSEKWEPVKKEKEETKTVKEDPETENNDSNSSEKSVDKGLKRKPNPVCFSIKKAKENEGLEVPSALPLEDSSDENEQETSPKNTESGKVESSPESSDNSDLHNLHTKEKKVESRKRKSYGREKDAHIQKERKLKVAQFLKCLKNKQT